MRTLGVLSVGLVAVMLLAASWALSAPRAVRAAFNDSDGDGVIDVAEQIGGSDPSDPNSTPESAGGSVYLNLPLCTDGVDNDLDGLIDGDDPGCVDTDGDFVDDPVELALGSDPNDFDNIPESALIDEVLASLEFVTFLCTDNIDNDLDGVIDAADPGCAVIDIDSDGYSDLTEKTHGSDPNDAQSQPEDDRVSPALCADRLDNDRDGLTDDEDQGCMAHPTATPNVTPLGRGGDAASISTPGPTVGGLPATGSGASSDPGADRLLLGLAALGGFLLAGAGAARARRRREGA